MEYVYTRRSNRAGPTKDGVYTILLHTSYLHVYLLRESYLYVYLLRGL